jgi:hypothetical protein
MTVAKKRAVALGKFFKKTMQRYDAAMAKPGATQLKAIKSTFGSTARQIPAEHLIGRQTLAAQFFYMTTVVDTRTGAISQSLNASPPYYGPLLPPADARIKGHFSPSQALTLLNTVAKNAR